MILPKAKFENARAFVATRGRPIDNALLACVFDGAPAHTLLEPLAVYQNRDGGFGHALEPDFRLNQSSAIATTLAFQYLSQIDVGPGEPLIVRAVGYLVDTLDKERCQWEAVPKEIDLVPRAPWWNFNGWIAEGSKGWANPGAECAAILLQYSEHVPSKICDELLNKIDEVLDYYSDEAMAGHDFLCLMKLLDVLEGPLLSKLEQCLIRALPGAIGLTASDWADYGIRPASVFTSKESILYPHIKEALKANLEYEIDAQGDDGSWDPFWTWGQFDEEWKVARVEWQGQMTARMLITLSAMEMIEP